MSRYTSRLTFINANALPIGSCSNVTSSWSSSSASSLPTRLIRGVGGACKPKESRIELSRGCASSHSECQAEVLDEASFDMLSRPVVAVAEEAAMSTSRSVTDLHSGHSRATFRSQSDDLDLTSNLLQSCQYNLTLAARITSLFSFAG